MAVLALILIVWQLLPNLGMVNRYILPPFSQVVKSLSNLLNPQYVSLNTAGGVYVHLSTTLTEVFVAFAITIVLGIPLAFAVSYSKIVGDVYEPLLYVIYSAPMVVFYPVLFLVFGLGEVSKITFALILGLFPLVVSVATGIRQVGREYVRLAKSVGADATQILIKVILPAAAPAVMIGIRLAWINVVIGVLFGEMVASQGGLGWILANATFNLDTGTVYAVILMSLGITFLVLVVLGLVEKRAFPHAA